MLGGVPAAARATLSQGVDDAQLVAGGRATEGLRLTARAVGGVPSTPPWSGEGARGGGQSASLLSASQTSRDKKVPAH